MKISIALNVENKRTIVLWTTQLWEKFIKKKTPTFCSACVENSYNYSIIRLFLFLEELCSIVIYRTCLILFNSSNTTVLCKGCHITL